MIHDGNQQAILSCADMVIDYGKFRAVDGVSFDVQPGKIVAILGPSGSGKSSVLRAIAGFVQLSGGAIHLGGTQVSSAARTTPPEMRRAGIAVQDLSLFPHLTAQQNVAFGLAGSDLAGSDKDEVAISWLERAGLSHRGAAYPHELSGGEQQRVALARALAPEPEIMLLDEAFSSLDPSLRAQLRRETISLLRETGVATLIVSHDPEEAMEVADELIIMEHGRILQQGKPETVYCQPHNIAVASLLGEVNAFAGTIKDGALHSPFGPIACDGFSDGEKVTALIRPYAMQLSRLQSEVSAHVSESQFLGTRCRIVIEASDGSKAISYCDPGLAVPPGSDVEVLMDLDKVHIVRD